MVRCWVSCILIGQRIQLEQHQPSVHKVQQLPVDAQQADVQRAIRQAVRHALVLERERLVADARRALQQTPGLNTATRTGSRGGGVLGRIGVE